MESIIHFKKFFPGTLRRGLGPILLLYIPFHLLGALIEYFNAILQDDAPPFAWAGSFLCNLSWEFISIVLIPYFVAREAHIENLAKNVMDHWKKHWAQVFIEYFRASLRILLWSLFLILPGLYKYTRLAFVPLIAQFDPEYLAGNKDALKTSENLTKNNKIALFFMICGAYTAVYSMILGTQLLLFKIYPMIGIHTKTTAVLLTTFITLFINVLLYISVTTYIFSIYYGLNTRMEKV